MYSVILTDVYVDNVFDAAAVKAQGIQGVIIKAGQGGYASLPYAFVEQCQKVGLPYGFYWVIDSRYSAANHLNAIQSTFATKDFGPLGWWWDCEKPMWTMQDSDYYKTAFAGSGHIVNIIDQFEAWCGEAGGMYTSWGFSNLIGLTSSNSAAVRLARLPLWTAQYNKTLTAPTLYGAWKDWVMWQYQESPDLNYFNGDQAAFKAFFKLGDSSVTLPNVSNEVERADYFPGMHYSKYNVTKPYGLTVFHVMEIDKSYVDEIFVTPLLRNYLPRLLDKYGMDFMVNGDGFDAYTTAGLGSSHGVPYGHTGEQTVFINKENGITTTRPAAIWNAISYPNALVVNGVIPTINKDVNDVRARTAWGWNKDQTKLYFLWVDGKDYFSKVGLNFQDCAKILLDLGCYNAVMQDGGGSTTAAVRDNGTVKVIGSPSGEDPIPDFGNLMMRPIANAIGIKMKSVPTTPTDPPTGGTMDQYLVLLSVTPRKTPDMYDTVTMPKLLVGSTFNSIGSITIPTTDSKVANRGVTFVQMENGYWVPVIYQAKEWVRLVNATTPAAKATAVVTLADGKVIHMVEA